MFLYNAPSCIDVFSGQLAQVKKLTFIFASMFMLRGASGVTQRCCFAGNSLHIPDPTDVYSSRWGSDPYSLGSYSCATMSGSGDDREVLAAPLPEPSSSDDRSFQPMQLLFAGECTSRDAFGTVHGAFATGQREADRLIRCYAPNADDHHKDS